MVARNGQPLAVGCFPVKAVCHPVTCYRPTVTSLAVVPKNYLQDTAEMIYKFLCINRTHPHFNLCIQTIHANTEESARLSLNADFRHLVTVAKINPKFNRTLAMKGGFMRNLSLHLIDEIQSEITRFDTLNTCLEMVGATFYLKDESELKGFMLNMSHFYALQCAHIQQKLDECFPKNSLNHKGAKMMTHKITLPDGTIIEIFTNADEVGQTDLDVQALWREAEQKAQRKMKLDEHIKHKSIQRKKNVAPPKAGKTETTLGEIWKSKQKPPNFY